MSEYTEEWLVEYTDKRAQQAEQREKNHKRIVGTAKDSTNALQGVKLNEAQKKTVKIILPFRLPTWNMLLAANPWQRKKVRDWIHGAMCTLEVSESDSLTPMELVLKPRLTASSIESYCRMITPKSSTKSATAKNRRKRTGRKLR